MNLGPFHFSSEISLGNVITIAGGLWVCVKYLRHFVSDIQVTNARMDIMWVKFHGKYENDPEGWFCRMVAMEGKINKVHDKVSKNRILVAKGQTRSTDNEGD